MRKLLLTTALLLAWCTGAEAQQKPNLVVIMTDDMDPQMVAYMATVRSQIVAKGTTLSRVYFNDPLCCPSRATMLTGRYVQNTKTDTNDHAKFYNAGMDRQTIAVQLDAAGYRTALVGKYLNNYPTPNPISYIPPGWNVWRVNAEEATTFYNYTLTDGSGGTTSYGSGAENYHDDVLGKIALEFVNSTPAAEPLFLWLSFHAPHTPATVAPRFSTTFPDLRVPRTPSFNEADVSDKPSWVRNRALMTSTKISEVDTRFRNMAQSLQAADEWTGKLIDVLAAARRLENTYIFFIADNGWISGQHRIVSGKGMPYEEVLRMAFHVRGPGVPAGQTREHLAVNGDLAPTLLELAGAEPLAGADARSLAPVLTASPPALSAWRKSVPLSYTKVSTHPSWRGVRTNRYTWVEWASGDRELYDNVNDPYQLRSLHAATATGSLRTQLASLTSRLRACAGAGCRAIEAENVP